MPGQLPGTTYAVDDQQDGGQHLDDEDGAEQAGG